MKKLKYLVILVIPLFLCGCDVTYTIEVNDENITENILVLDDKDKYESNPFEINQSHVAFTSASLTPYYYKQSEISNDDYYGINLDYQYDISDYKRSQILNSCYTDINIENNEDTISINATGFRCLNYAYEKIDNIRINLITDNEIVMENADQKEDNVLSWFVNENNYSDHEINVEIKKKGEERDYGFLDNLKPLGWGLVGIIIIACLIFLIIFIKQKKNNKI